MSHFATLTDPYRRELLAHCYRMLGSIHDAEDLVQETYLRAWRAFDRFEGRSSVRVWLYRIATRACLNAIDAGKRRALPSGLGAPAEDHRVALGQPSVDWLEPAPSGIFGDPASIVEQRSGVRLAFIAALQRLSARQRAVLILRDVLQWRAAEVATVLDTSAAAVNSALQRARVAIGADEAPAPEPADPVLLERYVTAFEQADLDLLVSLLRTDVELEMPPQPTWFTGRDAVVGFLRARVLRRPGTFRLIPTSANDQPAFLLYESSAPHGVQVLHVLQGRVARIVSFNEPHLVAHFETPARI